MDPRSPTPHTGSLSVPPIKGSDQDPSQAGPTPTSRADFVRSWGVGRGSSALPGPVPRLQTHSPADGTASHDHDRVGRVPGDGPAVDVVDPGMVGGYPCGGEDKSLGCREEKSDRDGDYSSRPPTSTQLKKPPVFSTLRTVTAGLIRR